MLTFYSRYNSKKFGNDGGPLHDPTTIAWLINPAYAKTISGFWQAQFLGEPGYAPAYLFLRNSIVSTILFSGVFSLIFIMNKEKRFFLDKTAQPTKA